MNAAVNIEFSEEQRADLATLLSTWLTRGSLCSLATSLLGREAVAAAGNDIGDPGALATCLVRLMYEGGCLSQVVGTLRREAYVNSRFMFGLNEIQQGRRLADGAALQAFVNEYEPFLSSAGVQQLLSQIMRTICAVWIGKGINTIVGTGFLIAPNLVLTNFHVLAPALRVGADGAISADIDGTALYFFFDYLSEPPPQATSTGSNRNGVAVHAAQDWLVQARTYLQRDGQADAPAQVSHELDYAVVKLATPIGSRPSRASGGAIRGWLPLPTQIDILTPQKRIMVFQHPGGVAQQFDIGDFLQTDASLTRVWYSVSAARGSSGGAAVDISGELFALHNAEVRCPPAPANLKINQGVRIDYIAKDLAARGWVPQAPANTGAFEYWSLTDEVADPQPILGRRVFRDYVERMMAPTGERVLTVTGPTGSGVRFSRRLLRRLIGQHAGLVEISLKDVQELTPERFLRTLVNGLDMLGLVDHPIPPPPVTETKALWLRRDLAPWLAGRLAEDEARVHARYPAWVVIDTFNIEGKRVLWADLLKELVAALIGVRDPGQAVIDLPQLRWVFLCDESNPAPVAGIHFNEDNLRTQTHYPDEFADCMGLAWRCVEGAGAQTSPLLLKSLGKQTLVSAGGNPDTQRVAARKLLATLVRNLVIDGSSEVG